MRSGPASSVRAIPQRLVAPLGSWRPDSLFSRQTRIACSRVLKNDDLWSRLYLPYQDTEAAHLTEGTFFEEAAIVFNSVLASNGHARKMLLR